jgi:Neurotransmitter-gated ion-channel ligand binding domain
MPGNSILPRKPAIFLLIILLSAGLLEVTPLASARAQGAPTEQEAPPVQQIQGTINPGEIDIFVLSGLKQGQRLYALLENTSGNLDPALSLVSTSVDVPELVATYRAEVQRLAQTSEDPLVQLPALNDRTFLAWDDDSGPGHDAALEFVVPQDGDYILGTSGALTAAGRITSGDYRLTLGLDAPEVLAGKAVPTGAVIGVPDETLLDLTGRVQEYHGSLDAEEPKISLELFEFDPGETLSIFIEATSGNLKPILILRDHGGKPVQVANLQGDESQASFEYRLPEGGKGYSLDIYGTPQGGTTTSGEFRLLAGVDAPQVLSGSAETNSQQVLRVPIEVQTGFKLQEIVMIDQSNEIMTAVGTIKLAWQDPNLAFSPDDCNCQVKQYTENNFNQFLTDTEGDWPDFTFFNQQGNRWTQDRLVEVLPDGSATYLERFTTNFQLNFDFSKYPFDREEFYIYADMLFPEDRFVMKPMEGFSEIDPEHGEDEFILTDFDTSVSSVISSRTFPTSRFTFHFSAPRFQMYYIFRIFVPVLLIILISYITFFLKDFTRRIEVATGNVLLFIAFSWSLAEDYPRMGYLTFLDAIMAITFAVNTLVVLYNVYLKWLEGHDMRDKADRIDRVADWVYPIGYVVLFGATTAYFFL